MHLTYFCLMPETSGILTKVVCKTQEAAVTHFSPWEDPQKHVSGRGAQAWHVLFWVLEVPMVVGCRVAHTLLPKGIVSGRSLSSRAGGAEPLTCKGPSLAPAKPLERACADPPHDS